MRLLPGNPVSPPPFIRGALERIFGSVVTATARIDRVRVIEHSLFARLHGRAIATTRRRRIYLRGGAAEFFDNPSLMLHEYCHVLLQWETGSLTTFRYVRECLRRGYWNNRFEVEAREFARRHEHQLRELLRSAELPCPSERPELSRAGPRGDKGGRQAP